VVVAAAGGVSAAAVAWGTAGAPVGPHVRRVCLMGDNYYIIKLCNQVIKLLMINLLFYAH